MGSEIIFILFSTLWQFFPLSNLFLYIAILLLRSKEAKFICTHNWMLRLWVYESYKSVRYQSSIMLNNIHNSRINPLKLNLISVSLLLELKFVKNPVDDKPPGKTFTCLVLIHFKVFGLTPRIGRHSFFWNLVNLVFA